jgi:hypothetical protein
VCISSVVVDVVVVLGRLCNVDDGRSSGGTPCTINKGADTAVNEAAYVSMAVVVLYWEKVKQQ